MKLHKFLGKFFKFLDVYVIPAALVLLMFLGCGFFGFIYEKPTENENLEDLREHKWDVTRWSNDKWHVVVEVEENPDFNKTAIVKAEEDGKQMRVLVKPGKDPKPGERVQLIEVHYLEKYLVDKTFFVIK